MPKLKDVIYINTTQDENHIMYYGIEFADFMKSLDNPLENILLIKHNFYSNDYHCKIRLDFVKQIDFDKLINDKVYNYGDFCWVDFQDVSSLDLLKANEIAELLYFGHIGRFLNSPFLGNLNNRFAYRSHDDGWHNELYCREMHDFSKIISEAIVRRAVASKRKKVNAIPGALIIELMRLSENGLLVDLNKVVGHNSIEVPIYIIGKLNDMDDMYHNLDKYEGKAQQMMCLVYKNKNWTLQ